MNRLAEIIETNIADLARIECLDMAMLQESLQLRVLPRGARNFRVYAEMAAAYEERIWHSNGTENRVIRPPTGPTVIITPWNARFMLANGAAPVSLFGLPVRGGATSYCTEN